VLHAWQQHFVTSHHPELWTLLKDWIHLTDQDEFNKQWDKIKLIAPLSVIQYLEKEWVADQQLWSAVTRNGRSIQELGDTNMLVEAYVRYTFHFIESSIPQYRWHHVLKGTMLQGKRNRRVDHLLYILTEKAVSYFISRHRRQALGFEGLDLES
jgi:hypothetical protein